MYDNTKIRKCPNILQILGKVIIFAARYKRNFIEIKIYCGVEQLVARWAHNPKVVGSSPAPATRFLVTNRKPAF
jgi:hypothetical protein